MARKKILKEAVKKRRRQKILRYLRFSLLAAILCLSALFAVFYLPFLRVKRISISGNETISGRALAARAMSLLEGNYFFIFPKGNLIFLPLEGMTKSLTSSFKRIKNIEIEREFPSGLLIKITERKPTALFCTTKKDGLQNNEGPTQPEEGRSNDLPPALKEKGFADEKCSFVDEGGLIFEDAAVFSGNTYIKFFGNTNAGKIPEFKRLMSFVGGALEEGIRINKTILEKDRIVFYTSRGWQIILKKTDDFNAAADNLKIFLKNKKETDNSFERKLEYVDLRFGNKIYYKLLDD